MKKYYTLFLIALSASPLSAQTTHQVCISEVYSSGACNSSSGIFTPGNLTIAVGDQIQFTTYMILLGGYNGTHTITFSGSSANNVSLPISTNIASPVTTVTTPPFLTPGVFPMECTHANHCFIADIMEGWSCTGYSVTVVGGCAANATFNASATTVCQGTTVNFSNTSTGATSYSWKLNEAEFSTATNSLYVFNTPGTYTVELIASAGAGCADSVTSTVVVQEAPLAGSDNTSAICNTAGTTLNLNTLLSGNNSPGTWAETTSSGQFNAGTGLFDAAGLSAGAYHFTYTVAGASPCANDVADFEVTVNQTPSIDLVLSSNTILLEDSVYVDYTTADLETGATLWFDFCGGSVFPLVAPFYQSWGAIGSYCICVTADNENGCTMQVCENVAVTDISGLQQAGQMPFRIYPNPTSGQFSINLAGIKDQATIFIVDQAGSIVRTYQSQPDVIFSAETNGLSKGIYQVRIDVAGETSIVPLIIQ